jgi:uncharacterized protein DUF4136
MRTVLTIGLLLVLGIAAAAQTVTYDYDQKADFSSFKTYAWKRGLPTDELSRDHIVSVVDAQLAAKGMRRAESFETPDVLIDFRTNFTRELQVNGWGSFHVAGAKFARTETVVVGTLWVFMRDANTNALVWRGSATHDLDSSENPDKRDKKLTKAAEKMFKNYPPEK